MNLTEQWRKRQRASPTQRDDETRPSDAKDSCYSTVSSVLSSVHSDEINSITKDKPDGAFSKVATSSKSHTLETRKPSVVFMTDIEESHDFDESPDALSRNLGNTPAFDAFGETKRRGVKSYNIEKRFLQCCRLVLYVVIICVVLGGGVLTKLSVLKLMSKYNQSIGQERNIYAIYFITLICIFPSLSMLSSLFKVLFGKVQSLSRQFICFLMVIELLQTIGVLLFLFKVLPNLKGIAVLYVMMSAPIIPSLLSLINAAVCGKGNYRKRIKKLTLSSVIFVLQTGGLFSFYFLGVFYQLDDVSDVVMWTAPLSTVLMSLGWWENFIDFKNSKDCKLFSLDNFKSDLSKPREKAHVLTAFCRFLIVGLTITVAVFEPDSFFGIQNHISSNNFTQNSMNNNTNNISNTTAFVFYNCSTFFKKSAHCNNSEDHNNSLGNISSTISTLKSESSFTDGQAASKSVSNWFVQLFADIEGFLLKHSLVLQIIALTFGVSYCATLACKLHMQRIGFSMTTLLISPLTLVYVSLQCGHQLSFEVITIEMDYLCPYWSPYSAFHIVLAVGLWISTCLLTFYVWFPDSERMAKIERMFVSQVKNCLFVDFNLLLRRRNDTKVFHRKEGNNKEKIVPKVYICATMWHENWKEMLQLLKSLLRIDRHCAMSLTTEKKISVTAEDPDKFEPEIHIIFDDAFCVEEESNQPVPNEYVCQFMECLGEAATEILGQELKNEWDSTPLKANLPYGGRLTWTLPGKTKMVAHLKNKSKIRHRKRWSQIMYLYYLLGFKTFNYKSKEEVLHDKQAKLVTNLTPKSFSNVLPEKETQELKNTFILTLDGDVDFEPKAVLLLIDRMKKNSKVGAVCGRIHPIGSGPMVWYQKFEYAISHWLQKAAEHVMDCVLCCPGCFSLFRASALIDDNVVKTYTKKPTKALHYIQFEQGEDRWLCTLLLQQGYKVDYCAGADAYTFAPETFNEFFIQRRRWSPSTNANIFDLLKSWRHTVQQNANISRLFMAYQGLMLSTSLLAPATVTLMISGSFSSVLNLDSWTSYILSIAPIIFFITICLKCKQETQLFFAAILSSIYTIVMIVVTVGTLLNITNDNLLSPNVLFLIGLGIIFAASAFWHPKEFSCLLHGFLYYVAVPSTFIFLTIYYICNLNVVTWGTRENKQIHTSTPSTEERNKPLSYFKQYLSKKMFKVKGTESTQFEQDFSDENNFDVRIKHTTFDVTERENISVDYEHWMRSSTFSKCKVDQECQNENDFWNKIIEKYLLPIEGDKVHEEKIKSDLISLRNNMVFAFFMINFMFSIALLQLQINRDKLIQLYIYGKYEPVSVIFLSLFSILLVLQFISMLIHRWGTFQHLISSTRVLSCRQLSEKEKFEIHFREAKEHIEQFDPVYQIDTENNIKTDANKTSQFVDLGHEKGQQENGVVNLYEKQVIKNFERTLRLKANLGEGSGALV